MNKSENTARQLEAALNRILDGKTNNIPEHRKLSVRAVEEEAGLGNGSCYYYPEIRALIQSEVRKGKKSISGIATKPDMDTLIAKRNEEKRIKQKYRKKVVELTNKVSAMAAEHHQLSWALKNAQNRIECLEKEILVLTRKNITPLK